MAMVPSTVPETGPVTEARRILEERAEELRGRRAELQREEEERRAAEAAAARRAEERRAERAAQTGRGRRVDTYA